MITSICSSNSSMGSSRDVAPMAMATIPWIDAQSARAKQDQLLADYEEKSVAP